MNEGVNKQEQIYVAAVAVVVVVFFVFFCFFFENLFFSSGKFKHYQIESFVNCFCFIITSFARQ